jgi:hypothetical protein
VGEEMLPSGHGLPGVAEKVRLAFPDPLERPGDRAARMAILRRLQTFHENLGVGRSTPGRYEGLRRRGPKLFSLARVVRSIKRERAEARISLMETTLNRHGP